MQAECLFMSLVIEFSLHFGAIARLTIHEVNHKTGKIFDYLGCVEHFDESFSPDGKAEMLLYLLFTHRVSTIFSPNYCDDWEPVKKEAILCRLLMS